MSSSLSNVTVAPNTVGRALAGYGLYFYQYSTEEKCRVLKIELAYQLFGVFPWIPPVSLHNPEIKATEVKGLKLETFTSVAFASGYIP